MPFLAKCKAVNVLLVAMFEAKILHLAGPKFKPATVYSFGVLLTFMFYNIISILPSNLVIYSSSSFLF